MGLNGPEREAELIRFHEPYVRQIAESFTTWGVPVDDLVQEGLIALMIAARKWRPDGGACLRTYSDRPIRSSMRRLIARRHLAHVGINTAMHLVGAEVPRAMSMDTPARSDDDVLNLHELLGTAPTQENDLGDAERNRILRDALESLDERERAVVAYRLQDEMTFEEIGERLAITDSTAFRSFRRAMKKLRSRLSHLTEEERHVE